MVSMAPPVSVMIRMDKIHYRFADQFFFPFASQKLNTGRIGKDHLTVHMDTHADRQMFHELPVTLFTLQ